MQSVFLSFLIFFTSKNKKVCANLSLHTLKTQTPISYHTKFHSHKKDYTKLEVRAFIKVKTLTPFYGTRFNYSVVFIVYHQLSEKSSKFCSPFYISLSRRDKTKRNASFHPRSDIITLLFYIALAGQAFFFLSQKKNQKCDIF